MTGASTGPHTHVGKWQGSQVLDPGTQGGKTLTSPKVIFTGSDSTNGNYIKLESQGYQWVYLHLNQINVKVGDIIGGGMTQDAIEKLVSKIYRVATDIDATPEQANYWVERIKADNNTAYELPVALGADDYKGDDMFRYKGRHYSEDMTTAKKQAYDQGLADGGGEATVLTPGKYQVK